MIRRLIPLALFVLTAAFAIAQTPKTIDIGYDKANQDPNLVVACPPGSNPDAGTSTQTLFPNAQSNDILFLCLGDSMDIQHFGGDLSGDPQPISPPGFSYVFYDCPPTATGPTAADILNDACHIEINAGNVTAVQAGVDINGNATFFNQGQVQAVLNGGAPTQVWYAPITLDDFGAFGFDPDPNTGEPGPCINVNTADAFTVTYLNAIEANNINTAANGNCTGSFTVTGGLPEFDGSNYTNISITLNTDPGVEADIVGANFTHNDQIEFTVLRAGIYNVLIEDDKSCAASFTIDMTGCDEVIFDASEEFANPGSTVCVQIETSDFVNIGSFQYTIDWDTVVISLPTPIGSSVNNLGALPDIFFGPANPIDALTVTWLEPNFQGETLPDGTGIFEICFDVIGAAGTFSPITFSGSLTEIEVGTPAFEEVGFNGIAGSVTVAGNIALTFTSCSSPAGGTNVGTFTINASGGIPPYSYTWVNTVNAGINGSGIIATNGGSDVAGDDMPVGDIPLPPGTYDVTLTDANGDIQMASVEIFDAPELLVFINGTPPTCANLSDGSFSITSLPLGGVAPHNIVWSTSDMGVTSITNLAQGAYSVTVTDAEGCMEVAQNGLQTPAIEIDTVSLQHVTCSSSPNNNDGAIIVQASGGVIAPGNDYGYAWDNGAFGPNISGLVAGTYCVSVTDDNNCEFVHCIDINSPMPPIVVDWDSVSVSCPTDMNGSLTVNAMAGNSPIDSYTWDPAQPGSDEMITGIGPGTYIVTITAVDGCTVIDSATLFAPTPLVFDSAQLVTPNCPGDIGGSINVSASGGTEPYTYTWNTGAVSNFPLLPGLVGDSTYTVTITDAGNCGDIVIEDIYLPDPPPINIQFTDLVDVTCNGGTPCNGQATALASGGTAGTGLYNFNWNPQDMGESFSGVAQSTAIQLCQGPAILEVNDGQCSVVDTVMIGTPALLESDVSGSSTTQTTCFGDDDGSATVAVMGGVPGYTYQWNNPPNISGPTINGFPAGTYSGIATDANGCTVQFEATIMQPDPLVAMVSDTIDASCAGVADGSLEVTWTGGNAGLATYQWTNNASTTSIANNLETGFYTVTVTDPLGCNDIATGFVNEPPAIFFTLDTIVDPECFGFQTFISIDTAFGGVGPPYSFSIDNGPIFPITSGSIPVLAGNHTVMVYDASPGLECSAELDTVIMQPPPIQVNLGDDVEIELGDSVLLEANIQALLTEIDSVIWSPATSIFTCADSDDTLCQEVYVMPLENTIYSVVAVDTNGCSGTDDILVEVDKNRNVYIPNIFTPDGDGLNDIFGVYTGVGVERIRFMRVYDRWGEQVFQGTDLPLGDFTGAGWNGFFKGKLMNPGVFIYLIEVEFSDGIVLLYRGDVTLMH